jgi:hypothetical protein
MRRPWHEGQPELVDGIRADLLARYPSLHLFINEAGEAEVRGTFPVLSPEGRELDRYQVTIELHADYPDSLPVVRETGGRIPWHKDSHVEPDGRACVLIPDDRWRSFPKGSPFRRFLEGPVHNYFLGQSLVAQGEKWPFGEWLHGPEGLLQYYQELLGTGDVRTVARFLYVLNKLNLKLHWDCPCGGGRKIEKCCKAKIIDLRKKIPAAMAGKAMKTLGIAASPYSGPRLR